MLWLSCSLLSTAVLLFLGFSWTRYRAEHNGADSFRVGVTQAIEVTLVRDDADNLSCASDIHYENLRCGFDHSHAAVAQLPERDTLRPYKTVKDELILAAGLWSSLPSKHSLPRARFTVVCNFHVTGVIKSASLRWSPTASFEPLERSVSLGSVTDCVIPP